MQKLSGPVCTDGADGIDDIDDGTGRRPTMTSVTIRNLDPKLKTHLRMRAAMRGCSMEEELRSILRADLGRPLEEVIRNWVPTRNTTPASQPPSGGDGQ
jgi:hypothetical protein